MFRERFKSEVSRNSPSPVVRMESSFVKNSLAIRSTRFFLKFTGFWIWENQRGKLVMDVTTAYTIFALLLTFVIVSTDLWFSRHDFQQAAFAACNVMTSLLIIIKLGIFFIRRDAFINLIKFCYVNFWQRNYDPFGKYILNACETRCVYFVLTFTFFANCTVFTYLMRPVIENRGKNETDRILPFNLWLNFPVTTTPYYEIAYFMETFSLIHTGICYFSFDNFLCIMSVHTIGQFRILQRKFELMCYDTKFENSSDSFPESLNIDDIEPTKELASAADQRHKLRNYVQEHQSLIGFTEMIEEVFTTAILCQFLLFSILICLVSYQAVLAADGVFSSRLIFTVHSLGTFTQLFMFTLTCDDLIQESQGVSNAAYRACWYYQLSNPACRNLSRDLMFVMVRSGRPCCLTAGGFFPVSLETFTTTLSTAISYLTLLRQQQESSK